MSDSNVRAQHISLISQFMVTLQGKINLPVQKLKNIFFLSTHFFFALFICLFTHSLLYIATKHFRVCVCVCVYVDTPEDM